MASCKINFPDQIFKELAQLGEHTDEVVEKMLDEGGKICEKHLVSAVRQVVGKNTVLPSRSTGELANSVKAGKVYHLDDGSSALWVSFKGHRRNVGANEVMAKRNGGKIYESDIAFFLEYGTSKMDARPFIKKARRVAQSKAVDEMTKTFDREVKKYVHNK